MFSQRLHDLRVERGITQKELADRLSLGRSTVAGYEVKGKQPDNARLCLLADFFGVSVDYLLGHTDNRAVIPPLPAEPAAPPDPGGAPNAGGLVRGSPGLRSAVPPGDQILG